MLESLLEEGMNTHWRGRVEGTWKEQRRGIGEREGRIRYGRRQG